MRGRMVATATAVLAMPSLAEAHVTVQPSELEAGGFSKIDIRVPNERDKASTTKVDVQLPPGFFFVSYQPVEGWRARIVKEKLDKPVESEGSEITEQVRRVTFTGDGRKGIIRPGQFQDFPLSVGVPKGKPGQKLKFPAIQTYSNGEVVRWIGPEDTDEPAPLVTLTAAEEDEGAAPSPTATPTQSSKGSYEVDDDSNALAIVALVVGGLGLIAGVAGLTLARRGGQPGTTA
jgi:uncharacterized protein YcnI